MWARWGDCWLAGGGVHSRARVGESVCVCVCLVGHLFECTVIIDFSTWWILHLYFSTLFWCNTASDFSGYFRVHIDLYSAIVSFHFCAQVGESQQLILHSDARNPVTVVHVCITAATCTCRPLGGRDIPQSYAYMHLVNSAFSSIQINIFSKFSNIFSKYDYIVVIY